MPVATHWTDLYRRLPVKRLSEESKNDVVGKAEAGTRDPKGKEAQRDESPDRGRKRVPKHELGIGTENKTSQEKVRVEQGGKNHRRNTN
jgi:hypothetical protein